MGVEILTKETKYYNQFKNDLDFTANPLDFTLNLTGSVGEKVKLVRKIEIAWFSKSKDTSSTWSVDTTAGTLSSNSGNFITDGFSVGDTFIYEEITAMAGTNFRAEITSINDTFISFTLISGSRVNTGDTDAIIRGTTDLTAMNYGFGLIENGESFNIESKVSGNDQAYYGGGIGTRPIPLDPRDTNFVVLNRLGQYKDWQTGSFKARFVSDNYDVLTGQIGSQLFEIEHEFIIVPYYIDGELSNLQNNVIPNILDGLNSLKYVYSPGFRTVISNPNTEKKIEVDNELGSVAWFNENFNGFLNDYQVNSVNYEEEATTNSADGILISTKTKIIIEVENNVANFSVGERAGVYVSYLPGQTEYTNTTLTDLKENFLYDNAINNGGVAAVGGQDFITDFEITNIIGNTMTLTFDVDYTIAQKIRLAGLNSQSPANFIIGVQLGDITIVSGNSNRVMVLADVNQYDETADVPGLWDFTKFEIYTHEKQIGVDVGTTDVTSWNEDGVAIDFEMELDLNKDAVLNSMDFLLLAYDPITQIYFNIDKYSFNIFPAIISSGIQQLLINTTRGYILEGADQFNEVALSVGANVGNVQKYEGRIGQKFSWQDWIENLSVDTVFFDSNEPNNNLNSKTSNYSLLNGYEIRLAFFGNVFGTNDLGISGLTNYLNISPTLTVFDYEKDGEVVPIWSEVIETFDESGVTNLNQSVLTGQNTLFRSTWTNSGGAVASLVGLWGINRIEKTNQPGYAITELSTINIPDANQLLIPTSGFTLCDMYLDSGNVVLECLIDGSIAQPNIDYNLSTRIQDDNVLIDGKITEEGVLKDTESGVQKIIE